MFKPEHAAVINSPLVQFTMGPDKLSQTGDSTTENYTINVAIVQYVAKATELLQYDIASIRAGQSAANATFDYDIVRLFNFMILNGRGTLPYYGEIMYGWYNQEVTDEIDYRYSAILITIIIDPLILFALMVAFIPFILSVQTRLLQIYIHLCKFKESDVRSWLESCNNSVADIKASAAAIRKVYGNTSFDVNVSMFEEEEKKGSNMKSTDRLGKGMHPPAKKQPMEDTKENQHSQNTQQPVPTSTFAGGMTITNKETNDLLVSTGVVPAGEATDEEKSRLAEILRSKEDDVAERKQKIFSQITRQKTMTYLLYLAFFAIYIGAFRIADILVFMTVYNYNTTTLTLYSTLTNRYLSGLRAEVFFREEIYANTPMSYFSRNSDNGHRARF